MKHALTLLAVLRFSARAADKPNIVYILCDDLGYGDVQCLNPQRGKIKTPNLDRLASQGMTFTDAHSGSSVCSPTRYGVLAGRYAWRTRLQHGVLDGYVTPLGKSELGSYGDFVMETDWAIGEVLAALDKAGIANNTLVIATSDNGCSPAAGTGRLEAQGHFASAQFRGYKADIWDGGHRMAFLARWPDRVKAGSQCAQLICHTDLMATCAEILGAKLPDNAGEDSVSILRARLGKEIAPLREAVVHHSISGKFAVRQGHWKLEMCPGSGGWGKPGDADVKNQGLSDVQLYDLSNDIGETKNVQAEHRDVVARLTKVLEQTIAHGRTTPGSTQKNDAGITVMKPMQNAPKEKYETTHCSLPRRIIRVSAATPRC